MKHLSSDDYLSLAEENIQKADARGITPKMFALIGIGQTLIVLAKELKKFNDRIDEDRKSESRTIDEDIRRGFIRIEEKIIGSSEQ